MNTKLLKIEMMRGFAALYVMIGHLLHRFVGEGSWVGLPFRFGQEAVMLFFLISGFVVFYSTEKQRPDFPTYLGRRWSRIYPIFLLAIGVSAFDLAVLQQRPISLQELLGNLCMLQDFSYGKPGVWFPTFGGNSPLWSLAYEWWFYMLFYPIWRYVAPRQQRLAAAGISMLGVAGYVWHPNQPCLYLTYFILWWTGAEFARQYMDEGRVTFSRQSASLWMLASFACLVAVLLFARRPETAPLRFGLYPILQIRHFAASVVIALGALFWQRLKWRGFEASFGVFLWFAPISYGIYVLHYPLAVNGSFMNSLPTAWGFPAGILLALGAAWLTEVPFQNLVKRLTKDLFPMRIIPKPVADELAPAAGPSGGKS